MRGLAAATAVTRFGTGRMLLAKSSTDPGPQKRHPEPDSQPKIGIAVDINGPSPAEPGSVPGYFDTVFGSVQIMQQAIMDREIEIHPPDIYFKPELSDIRTLQFYRADEIYRQALPAKEELKTRIAEKLSEWNIDTEPDC